MKKIIEVPDYKFISRLHKDELIFTDKGNHWEITAIIDQTGNTFNVPKGVFKKNG